MRLPLFASKYFMAPVIKPQTAIFCAISLLVVPLSWMSAWIIAAAVHETCHFVAVWICGGQIERFGIGFAGAEIQSHLESNWQSVFCSLAGPLGGLYLLLFADTFPRLAICALIQSVYNILPVYPLDGGRLLRSLLSTFCSERTVENLCRIVEFIVFICMFGFALCMICKLGILPVIVVLAFLLRTKKIKIPCK